MTLEKLPKFEMYEEGSQIRRSSKSISSNNFLQSVIAGHMAPKELNTKAEPTLDEE